MTKMIAEVSFTKRESFIMGFRLCESDGVTPLDLNGSTITWKLASGYGQSAIITASLGSGISIVGDSEDGEIDVNVTPSAHNAVSPGNYVHQVDVILSDGRASTQIQGKFIVREAI